MEGPKKSAQDPRLQRKKSQSLAEPRSKVQLSSNMEPTYYIGGGNGNAIIEEIMNGLGWKRIKDKSDESYKLRWCELKGSINYNSFKEGDQMVNHIPNCNLLTNKLGLLNSLQEYNRACATVQRRTLNLDFIPETYRLDHLKDREAFVEQYKENEIWICKPTGRNQGKGIFLVRSLAELDQAMADTDQQNQENILLGKPQKPLNRIIQRYITNPLLVEGRKFDIRCYMLIASTVPYLVLYHKGYIRLSMYEYDNNCDNIIAHLTNQFIQKKDPKYSELKEETAWSMDRFNQYINSNVATKKGLECDWVYNTLPTTMKRIMTHLIMTVKHRLQRKVGYFELYGLDFMIDEDMKIWLIEVNINPCLATNCGALKEVVPGVVQESLNIAIECFEKSRRNRPLQPLNSVKNFELLYCDAPTSSSSRTTRGTISPTHATRSARGARGKPPGKPTASRIRSTSPVKESREPDTRMVKNELTSSSTLSYSQIGNRSQYIRKNDSEKEASELTRSQSRQKEDGMGDREMTNESDLLIKALLIDSNKSGINGKGDNKQTVKSRSSAFSKFSTFKTEPYNMAQVNLELSPRNTSTLVVEQKKVVL